MSFAEEMLIWMDLHRDYFDKRHYYREKKNLLIGFLLGLFLGPFGYLYISWRYFILALFAFFVFALFVVNIGVKPPDWMYFVYSLLFAFNAYHICVMINSKTNEELVIPMNSFTYAMMPTSQLFSGLVVITVIIMGIVSSVSFISEGLITKGLIKLLVITPLLSFVSYIVVKFLGALLIGLLRRRIERLSKNGG